MMDSAPSLAELQKVIVILESGGKLNAANRRFVINALDCLFITLIIERDQHKRGRPKSYNINTCAAVVKELHEKHGIKIAAAVSAMVRTDFGSEDSRRKARQTIEREYRKLKKSRDVHQINERLVQEALLRINPRKTGNK